MNKLFYLLNFFALLIVANTLAQTTPSTYTIKGLDVAEKTASRLRYLTLPEHYRKLSLPMSVDNSTKPFMRPVFSQAWYPTCMQCSSVGYTYNYEINRARNLPADTSANRYAVMYTWNYANDEGEDGLDFFFTYDVIKKQGIPSVTTYGADAIEYPPTVWMNGYQNYYEAMHNRLDEVMGIKLDSEEGINTLRAWLYDHLDGSPSGGLAVFASSGYGPMYQFEAGTPEAGKSFYVNLLNYVAHGLTVVGYNDSVRYDYNHDGKYTNNIDLNFDGKIDVRDWEKGAFKIVNSHGVSYADSGYAYIMYNCMTRTLSDGGIWNSSVYVVNAQASYSPELTIRAKIEHNNRKTIRLRAGIATQPGATQPEHLLEFPIFNYQGGQHTMQGLDTVPGSGQIEIGLDISTLKQYAIPNTPIKFFLLVDEDDPLGMGSGSIIEFAVIDYMAGGTETSWNGGSVALKDNATTLLFVEKTLQFNKMQISTQQITPPPTQATYQIQLTAQGGQAPYTWHLNYPYTQSMGNQQFTTFPLAEATPVGVESNVAIKLPFPFPFYGKVYDTVYMNRKGLLVFTPDQLPPRYFDDYLLLLKNNAVINPGFRDEFEIYAGDGDGMWYGFTGDTAVFRWKLSVLNSETYTEAYFETRLRADGKIQTVYKTMDLFDELVVHPGISAGDGKRFMLNPAQPPAPLVNKSMTFEATGNPKQIELTAEGLLSINQHDSVYIETIDVEVHDNQNNGDQKRFYLSDGLHLEAMPMAGPGALAVFNQPTLLRLQASNQTSANLAAVEFRLRTQHPGVLITDSLSMLTDLATGATKTLENAFSFTFTQALMGGQIIDFEVLALYNGTKRILRLPLVVGAPFVVAGTPKICDADNGQLDPGETSWVEFQVQNSGNMQAGQVQVEVLCNDMNVSILSNNQADFDSIPIGSAKNFQCLVKIAPEVAVTDSVTFIVKITYGPGLDTITYLKLQVGSFPVALINLSNQSQSIDSMAFILNKLNIPFEAFSTMPSSLKSYKSVFISLGSSSPAHILTSAEEARIIAYLNNGGNLYIEGYYFMFFPPASTLPAWLNFNIQNSPLYFFKTLQGIEGSETANMQFKNASAKTVSIKEINYGTAAFTLLQSPEGKPIQFASTNNNYKTIASAVDFGYLTDSLSPSTKHELMKVYLDFFGVDTTGLDVFFHSSATEGCVNQVFSFTDDSPEPMDSYAWQFPGGNPGFSNQKNPTVTYAEPGIYDVTLSVSKGLLHRSSTKNAYIQTNACSGNQTHKPSTLLVFPNPAKGLTMLSLPSVPHGYSKAELLDAAGKLLRTYHLNSQESICSLNLEGIKPGFYILSVSGNNVQVLNRKLMVN